jgi:hypothetical protein
VDGTQSRRELQSIALGVAAGLIYGLTLRLYINLHAQNSIIPVMSVAFLILVPVGVGYISVYSSERVQSKSWLFWVFFPWVPILASCFVMAALLWEGFICIVMFLPVGVTFATLGGVLGGFVARSRRTRRSDAILGCILLLPLVIGSVERHIPPSSTVRTVETSIDIHAEAPLVWANIERVPAIKSTELSSSWSHRIGFPDPIEATLSEEGIGGIRHATFRGGVLFIETIDVWEPERRLAFSIHPDAEHIPETTFDEHVKVGGQYFDVLRGEYRLESMPGKMVRLHLSSQHRISTDFNWYAQLWTDGFMRDIQATILRVIKNRCETGQTRG